MSGLFITFEGVDGCGKTTQIKLLKEHLEKNNKKVVLIREPGGTNISEKVRDIILDVNNDEMAPVCEMLLYAAARAQLVKQVINESLMDNAIVLCDRFIDSSFVYQGIARGIGIEKVKRINDIATDGLMPDVTLFFDIAPDVALKRRSMASSVDRIEKEKLEFHKMVYNGYKKIMAMYPDRIKRIDASCDIDQVTSQVFQKVQQKRDEKNR